MWSGQGGGGVVVGSRRRSGRGKCLRGRQHSFVSVSAMPRASQDGSLRSAGISYPSLTLSCCVFGRVGGASWSQLK